MADSVSLTYTRTPADVEAVATYISTRSPFYRRPRNLTVGWIASGALVLAIFIAASQETLSRSVAAFLIVGLLGSGIAWMIHSAYPGRMGRVTRQMYEAEANPDVLGKQNLTIGDIGVVSDTDHARVEMRWGAFIGWAETDWGFLLFITSFHALMIPKREISAQQMDIVRQLLSTHLPPNNALEQTREG